MDENDVMILGAGAVGCVVGGHLAGQGHRVQLINRTPDTGQAVASMGLRIEGDEGIQISHPDAATPEHAKPARFILCFTKTHQTAEAVRTVLPRLAKDSIFVSMQNGLGNGQLLHKITNGDPIHNVIHGVTLIPATVLGPGHVRSHGTHKSWLGPLEIDNPRQIAAAQELTQMLVGAGLDTEYHLDVHLPIWQKACFNVAMNGLSALADAPPGLIGDSPALKAEAHYLADETIAVAHGLGIMVNGDQVHQMISFACAEHRYHQPSMLQDIRAQRQTEISSLNGYIIEQAETLGLEVPRNRLVCALVMAREAAPAFWKTQPE